MEWLIKKIERKEKREKDGYFLYRLVKFLELK